MVIWFNNLESYGTPNYYVQKLFSNNKGTALILRDGLNDENYFAAPTKISPKESEFKLKGNQIQYTFPVYSVTVLKIKMK